MNFNILLVYFILNIIAVVKGETLKPAKSIPAKSIPIPTETLVTHTPKIVPTGVPSLANAPALAKEYCVGYRNVEIMYNNEDFVCHMYDYYNTSGCLYYYVNERTITSIPNDCHRGSKITDGIYDGYDIYFNNSCGDKISGMKVKEFIDETIPLHDDVSSAPSTYSKHLVKKNCVEWTYTTKALKTLPTNTKTIPTTTTKTIPITTTKTISTTITTTISITTTKTIPETTTKTIPETTTKTVPDSILKTIPDTIAKTIPNTVTKTIPSTVTETIQSPGLGRVVLTKIPIRTFRHW